VTARTAKGRQSEAVAAKADSTIDFLCSMQGANTTVPTRVFRSMLLRSDGYVMWKGKRYEIKGKSLGAGVYRVTLEDAV
jgi:hypothetical protein